MSSAPIDFSSIGGKVVTPAPPIDFSSIGGAPVQSADVPAATTAPPATQQPGYLSRVSQAVLGTEHPWDQAKSEWDQFTSDPVGRLEKSAKQAAMIPVNMAYQAVHHPLDTAESILPINRAIGDVKSGNYGAAAGDITGAAVNLFMMAKGKDLAGGTGDASPAADATASMKLKAPEDAAAAASDFQKAIPPSKSTPYTVEQYTRARPYLEEQHAANPISEDTGVTDTRDAADAAIGKIEDKVAQAIKANPTDQITTNPLNDVRQALSTNQRGEEFVNAGLNEIKSLNLDQPKTVAQADAIRRQLNLENQAALTKNNYKQNAAIASDPAFAARTAAAESLRNGIYGKLEQRGIEGVSDLRQDEGALIAIRNAAQDKLYSGDQTVRSTGIATTGQKVAASVVKAGATGGGAALGSAVAGAPGALGAGLIGAGAGELAAKFFTPEALTRNELLARSFSKKVAGSPEYLSVPPSSPVRGLLGPGATPMGAGPDTSGPINLGAPTVVPTTAAERFGRLLGKGNRTIEAGPVPDTSGPVNLGAPFSDPSTRAARLGLLLGPKPGEPLITPPPSPQLQLPVKSGAPIITRPPVESLRELMQRTQR